MNTRRLLVPSLLALAAFTGTSYAALLKIGINFLGRDGAPTIGPNEVAGVDAQADWNNLGANLAGEPSGNFADPGGANLNNITSGALFTDNGIADGTRDTSAVTVTVTSSDAWHSDGNQGTANERLMRGAIKAGNAQGTVPGGRNVPNTVNFHNLDPSKKYKIIAYGGINNGNNGNPNDPASVKANFGLVGAVAYDTYYFLQYNQFIGSFVQGTNTANVLANRALANYIQWSNVVPTATGDLNFTYTWVDGGDGVGLNGIQIVELPPASVGDAFWGVGNGNWNTTEVNWNPTNAPGAPSVTYAALNAAHFGDLAAAGPRTVTVDAAGITAGNIDVNNALTNPYTLTGGPIHGGGDLIKDGPGTLTLDSNNDFTGITLIKHGTVEVSNIGDLTAGGNLGQAALITIGDVIGTNDARLNYVGGTAIVARTLNFGAAGSLGGTINVDSPGQTLFLTDLTGSGKMTKSGPGPLVFNGIASTHTGSIEVATGTLSIKSLGSGAVGNQLILNTGTAFSFTGTGNLADGRGLVLNGNATMTVPSATASYSLNGDATITGVLTKTGTGRLEIGGAVNFPQLPVITSGTLALTKDGGVTLPAGGITLAAGRRLEIAPGALGAANPITLSGGTLRVGRQGLQVYIFSGGYNQGEWTDNMNGSPFAIGSYFAAAQGTLTQVRTTANPAGLTYGQFNGNAPFASLGVNDPDNVRAVFTGKIRIDAAGATTFFTSSDDGSGIFIDGTRVVLNNNYQGNTTRSGTITLAAGLHDFLMYYTEGGGDAGLIAQYTPAGGTQQVIPNSVLTTADTADYSAAPIIVTSASLIESGAALAQMGVLTLAANTLLTVSGSARFTGTTLQGTTHQVSINGFNANSSLGILSAPTTLTKIGTGNLVFLDTPPAGTAVTAGNGLIVAMGSTALGDPLATTTLTFAGGGFGMSSTSGDVTYSEPVSSSTNLTIAAGSFGNGNITQATAVTYSPANLVAPTGNTLTLRVNDGNFTLNITAPITGTGAIVTEEGKINLNGGINNVGNNFTNRSATVVVNGNVATNTLSQTGTLPNFGGTGNLSDNLIAGQYLPGSITVTGSVNATAITTTRGTLSVTGPITNTGALTGNGNGVMNLGNSSHTSATLTSNATLNANGTFNATGTLTVTGATANLNAAAVVDRAIVNGNATLKLATTLATNANGLSASQGATVRFDPGVGNTAAVTGGNVSLDSKATLQAFSGVADLTAVAIHGNPLIQTLNNNTLGGRITILGTDFSGGPRLDPRNAAIANQLYNATQTPAYTAQGLLSGNLDFNDDNVFTAFFVGTPTNNNFAASFSGRFTPTTTGTYTFAIPHNDDQAAVWVDVNQNGTFDGGELISSVDCCDQTNAGTTPELTAGQTYNFMAAVQDTGGGGAMRVSMNGVTLNTTGQFSYISDNGAGSNFQIEGGAEMRVKTFDGVTNLRLANGGILTVVNQPSQSSSDATRIQLTGSAGTLLLGDKNIVTVGELLLGTAGTLTIDQPPGATTGGRLVVNGNVAGFSGVATDVGGSIINVLGGSLIVKVPINGFGIINATLSGTIGGTSAINLPINIIGSGTLAPGDPASNGGIGKLSTLDLTNGGNFNVDLLDSGGGATPHYDQLSVTGALDITNATLNVTLAPAFAASPGNVFQLVLNDSTDPVFGQFAQGTSITVGIHQFAIVYDADYDAGGIGNDIGLIYVAPEPGTVVMLLGGMATLVARRARRRPQA